MMLEKYLEHFSQECVQLNSDQWLLSLRNGSELTVSARREDGFLLLDAETNADLDPERLVGLCRVIGSIAGNVKLALPDSRRLHLHAEFPLPEDGADKSRVRRHLLAMQSAHQRLHDWTFSEDGGTAGTDSEDGPADFASLEEVLTCAGWESHKRVGGALLADLEAHGHFFQADVKRLGEDVRFRATTCCRGDLSQASRRALSLYLLEANATVRYARSFLERSGSGFEAGFEVYLDCRPEPTEAGHALSALSVACRHCAREIDVLSKDASLARCYWSVRGLPFLNKEQAHG